MRNQLVEINDQYPSISCFTKREKPSEVLNEAAFWIDVYPPLHSDHRFETETSRQVCPWTLAAELADRHTTGHRWLQILTAFKNGRNTMNAFHLPADRIIFLEEFSTKKISIWID